MPHCLFFHSVLRCGVFVISHLYLLHFFPACFENLFCIRCGTIGSLRIEFVSYSLVFLRAAHELISNHYEKMQEKNFESKSKCKYFFFVECNSGLFGRTTENTDFFCE
jgi:hypothetical protein